MSSLFLCIIPKGDALRRILSVCDGWFKNRTYLHLADAERLLSKACWVKAIQVTYTLKWINAVRDMVIRSSARKEKVRLEMIRMCWVEML